MDKLTSYERIKRMYEHRPADRIPVTDSPWDSTVERWRREGMPADVTVADFFGLDKTAGIWADNGPRFPTKVIAETEDYIIQMTSWGATQKTFKHHGSVPEFIDYVVKTPDDWRKAKERMTVSRDRVDWARLKEDYPKWRREGRWVAASFWFGFDITHARFVGTERLLMAMATDPEWVIEMWNHQLDLDIALFEMVWDAGYHFDAINWPEDMGYKLHTFFSLDMYRQMLKPVHKRACDWAKSKGVKVHLHSCGDIRTFVPDLIEIGVDMLNPLEVKAGCDPVALKKKYGDKLTFWGGLGTQSTIPFGTPESIKAEVRRLCTEMGKGGGYILSPAKPLQPETSAENAVAVVEAFTEQ